MVLPAVHANGLPAGPSRTPGACPINITGDMTGKPVTTGPIISGQALHPRSRVTWRFNWIRADTAALWRTALTLALAGVCEQSASRNGGLEPGGDHVEDLR